MFSVRSFIICSYLSPIGNISKDDDDDGDDVADIWVYSYCRLRYVHANHCPVSVCVAAFRAFQGFTPICLPWWESKEFRCVKILYVLLCNYDHLVSKCPLGGGGQRPSRCVLTNLYNVLCTVSTQQYISTMIYTLRSHYGYVFRP